jgi:uncharacterized membrane protein YdjX (TVP38/TMEM64 family)
MDLDRRTKPSLRARLRAVPRGYAVAAATAFAVLLAGFVLIELLRPQLLTDPSPWMDRGGPVAAIVGVALLVADVAVPAPSSVVMVAHGALFGVVGGTLLSLLGGAGATLAAFAIGRRSRGAVERRVRPDERERVRRGIERRGVLLLVVTRPVPLVAETVALVAGTTPMSWRKALLGGVLGNVVPAFVYAVAGSHSGSLAEQGLVLVLVLLLSAGLWALGRRRANAD